MNFNLFFSPFEQFIVTPILPLNFIFFDFTITNATVVLFILVCGTAYFFLILRNPNTNSLYLKPTVIDSHFHLAYIAVQTILEKHVHVKYYQQIMFPITFASTIFLFMLNLGGNLPIFMGLTVNLQLLVLFQYPELGVVRVISLSLRKNNYIIYSSL